MSSKDYIYCYQGSALRVAGSTAVIGKKYDPYNPLGLPPFTIRCKFRSGYNPTMGDSRTLVDATENVWDITKNSTDWSRLFFFNDEQFDVLGANTTNVTDMHEMFRNAWYLNSVTLFDTSTVTNMSSMFISCGGLLTTIPLYDTSSCIDMSYMFSHCYKLTSIPLLDTSSCRNMSSMFYECNNVQSGALAIYQQASTQATPPSNHYSTFTNCGRNTVTGAAELAQIPTSWGGTMAE